MRGPAGAISVTEERRQGIPMSDELYDRYAKEAVETAARTAFSKGVEVGHAQGFVDGIALGQGIGFVAGVQSLQAALPDGTRKGSSECARALESLKRLGVESAE